MIKTLAAPLALALALTLGACGTSGTDANAVAANETVLNDTVSDDGGLLSNDHAGNLVDESATGADLSNGALGNDTLGNGSAAGNAF